VSAVAMLQQSAPARVAQLRAELDRIDAEILDGIAQRCVIAHTLGRAKRAADLPLRDMPREAAVVRRAAAFARAHGLDEERVRQIYWMVIDMARNCQGAGT
jgi:chorismate mutase